MGNSLHAIIRYIEKFFIATFDNPRNLGKPEVQEFLTNIAILRVESKKIVRNYLINGVNGMTTKILKTLFKFTVDEKLLDSFSGCVKKMIWIAMKMLQEGYCDQNPPSRFHNPLNFGRHFERVGNVLKHGDRHRKIKRIIFHWYFVAKSNNIC